MLIRDLFAAALRQFVRSPLRAALTMLGIGIGIGALTAVVSLGSAGKSQILGELSYFGSNRIWVQADNVEMRAADAKTIKRGVSDLVAAAPITSQYAYASRGKQRVTVEVVGTDETMRAIEGDRLTIGRFISSADALSGRRVVVLGSTVADKLFSGGSALGQKVQVHGAAFTVIGVLKSQTLPVPDEVLPDTCYIPLSAFSTIMGKNGVDSIVLAAREGADTKQVQRSVRTVLSRSYANAKLKFRSLSSEMEVTNSVIDIFMAVMSAVAGISLLVGGIGVMSMMLVTVTERTREIGVRKALGTQDRQILLQFILESLLLSGAGGVVGLGLGAAMTAIFARFASLPFAFSLQTALYGILFSLAVGVIFGVYPAMRAARLDPVYALRKE